MNAPFLNEKRADLYFLNAQQVLETTGKNPTVTMDVFPNSAGLFCGVDEAISHLTSVLPDDVELWALPEGEKMAAKECVLRIRGRYLSFGIYETALLGTLAHGSGWATAARECVTVAGEIPVISFGARHVHPSVSDRMEYAALVGGCSGCATQAGGILGGIEASGTMPHTFLLIFGDTVEGALAFDQHMAENIQRIVLVDTFKDEVEESLRVAEAMGDRLWGVRLDTPSERGRVTPELVVEVRANLDLAGYHGVKILVSGGIDAERIRMFVGQGSPIDGFGVGSAISGARPIDFTADVKEIDGRPVAKRGRLPGVIENSRLEKLK